MSDSLRRSSRRVKKRTYKVGDIVEIVTQNDSDRVLTKGRLIAKLTADTVSAQRWLVGFDDESWPEEELVETSLGEILGKSDNIDKPVVPVTGARNRKGNNASNTTSARKPAGRNNNKPSTAPQRADATPPTTTNIGTNGGTSPSSSNDDPKAEKSKKKRVVFEETAGSGVMASDASSSPVDNKRAAARSAREQRSKRRQAQQPPLLSQVPRPHKKAKLAKQKEDAVRIPMLTGTLFLYRGAHRRAEFVRKV